MADLLTYNNVEEFYSDEQNEEFIDLNSNLEWLDYLERCESWKEKIEEDNLNEEYIESEKPLRILKPTFLNNDYENNSLIVIGNISSPKKTKSFKYKNQFQPKKILCNSVLLDKPCEIKNCRENHNFKNILFCRGNCDKITNENNFYFGNCNKRHSKETFINFILRKKLKFGTVQDIRLEFFERPNSEFLKKILTLVKENKNISNLTIGFCQKSITLKDFLFKNKKEDNDINPSFWSSEELKKIWLF